MRKNRLGQTNLFLPSIGYGCSSFAGFFGDVPQSVATEAVQLALRSGINFFDTSPLYSSLTTRSEEVLGIALKGKPRDSFIVNTKCGRERNRLTNEYIFDYTPEGLRRSFEGSLKRLQLQYVDMLTLHDVEYAPSMHQIVNEALPELRRIQKSGGARYIGISGYPLDVLIAIARRFKLDFVLTYANYSLQNEKLADYAVELTKLGCGLINAAPLAMGFFTKQGPPPGHPAPVEMKCLFSVLSQLCSERGLDVSQVATKYALHGPLPSKGLVACTLVGLSNSNQVRALFNTLSPITQTERECLDKIKQILKDGKWLNYTWTNQDSNQVKLLEEVEKGGTLAQQQRCEKCKL